MFVARQSFGTLIFDCKTRAEPSLPKIPINLKELQLLSTYKAQRCERSRETGKVHIIMMPLEFVGKPLQQWILEGYRLEGQNLIAEVTCLFQKSQGLTKSSLAED